MCCCVLADRLTINVNNMATTAGNVLLTCSVRGSASPPQTQTVAVPPRGATSATFRVDIAAAVRASESGLDVAALWGVAAVDVIATAAAGGEGEATPAGWEERLSMNFMTVR
jgi:hypothetical protein